MSTNARPSEDLLFIVEDTTSRVRDANAPARARHPGVVGKTLAELDIGVECSGGLTRVSDDLALLVTTCPMGDGRTVVTMRSGALNVDAALERVAASVNHGLRNSLGAIQNATHYLAQRLNESGASTRDARLPVFVDIIELELRRASNVLGDFVALASDPAPLRAPLHLRKLVDDAAALVPRLAAGPTLENAVSDDLPLVDADAAQLRHALTAVMQNAIEATPNEGRVRVSAESEPGFVHVDVVDQGPGVPESLRADLFRALFTTKLQGTGFGLAIVRAVAQRHGGSVLVTDAPGGGARFRISLPNRGGPVADR